MASCQVPIGMTASATRKWNGEDLGAVSIPNGTGAQSYSWIENKYLDGRGCCFRNFSTGEHGVYSVGSWISDQNNTAKIPKDVNDIMNKIDEAVCSHRFEDLMILINKAEQLLKPVAKERPKVAANVYDSMIKACAASAKPSVQEHAPGNFISNNSAHKAFHLVGSMWRQGIPVGRVAQGSLIKCLCDAGYARKAFKHLKSIPKSRLHPSFFNIILDACIHSGELDIGKEAAQRCLRYNAKPDALTWSLILKLHGMLGDRDGVEFAWASLLDTCPWTTNGDGNAFQKDFDESDSESFKRYSHTISYHDKEVGKYMVNEAYVQSLVASGDLETAYSACNAILDMAAGQYLPLPLEISNSAFQIRSSNEDDIDLMRLDAVIKHIRNACNIILHASECQHNWNTMKNLVGSMATHGLPPDTHSYNYLLWASYRRGEGIRILKEGLEEMKALGLVPNADSYELMMEASLKYNAPSMAKEYLHECMKNTTRGQGWAWGSILKAHGKVGDLPGLLNSFNEMIEELVEDSEHIRTRKTLRGLEGCLVGLKLATELLLEDIENLYIHSLAGAAKGIIGRSNELSNNINKNPHLKEETLRDRVFMLGRLAEAMSLYPTQNTNNKSYASTIVSPRHLQEIKMARTMLRRVTSDLHGGIDSLKTSSLADLISIHGNLGDLKDVLKILQHKYRFNAEVPCITGSAGRCDQESSMICFLSNKNRSKNDHWQKSSGASCPSLKPDPIIIDAAVGAFGKMNRWDLVLSTLQWMAVRFLKYTYNKYNVSICTFSFAD